MAAPYDLVLFDCFNTLFFVDETKVPRIILEGEEVPSTADSLRELLRPIAPELSTAAIHRAHRASWKWAETQRGAEYREFPAVARFRHLVEQLGLGGPDDPLIEQLTTAHIAAVVGCYQLPARHRELLQHLRMRTRLALLSNFDHGPGLRTLLREVGIETWFDPLVISAEVGYRKPGRAAFDHAFAAAGVSPQQVLFVGDSPSDDVAGAQTVGVDVAWLNRDGAKTAPAPAPTYTVTELPQIEHLLD